MNRGRRVLPLRPFKGFTGPFTTMSVDSAQREPDPDAELLARVAREDASAVRQLVARIGQRLLRVSVEPRAANGVVGACTHPLLTETT